MEISVDGADSEVKTPTPQGGETTLRSHEYEEKPGLRLPTSTIPDTSYYWGAYVFEPQAGRHENVVYPDHSAMYPNMIRQLNISPETIIGTKDDLEESEWTEDDCVWGYIDTREVKRAEKHERWQQYKDSDTYKAVFQRNSKGKWKKRWGSEPRYERCYYIHPDIKRGFVSDVVDDMLVLKDEYDGTDMYQATKQIVNSTYGVLGYATEYNAFRLFDWRMAETVTLTGRKLIQHTAEKFSEYIEDEFDTRAPIVYGDTDSCVCSMPEVGLRSTCLDYAQQAAEYYNEVHADQFMKDECNVDDHHVELEIESYSPTAYFHHKKKKYFTRVTWDEGDEVDDLNVKGFEYARSDVSDLTQDVQEYLINQILYEDRGTSKANIYEYLRDVVERVESGSVPLKEVGKRTGISKPMGAYGKPSRSPQPGVRGAKYAKENIPGEENLGQGSKPLAYPVDELLDDSLPRTYDTDTGEDGNVVDYVAVEEVSNIKGVLTVCYNTVVEKQIKKPTEDILENMGWSWSEMVHSHEQQGLADFM